MSKGVVDCCGSGLLISPTGLFFCVLTGSSFFLRLLSVAPFKIICCRAPNTSIRGCGAGAGLHVPFSRYGDAENDARAFSGRE